MKTKIKRLLLIAALIFGYWAYVHYNVPFYITKYINFETLNRMRGSLLYLVKKHYWRTVYSYIGTYIIISLAMFPSTSLVTLVGGFMFGTRDATIYTNIGATIGALCVFILSRHLIGEILHDRYEKQLTNFNDHFEKEGHWYLLSLRFSPIFPFFLVNVLAGLTNVNTWTFLWTTIIGIIPGSLVYAFAGRQFSRMHTIEAVFTKNFFSLFLALMALSLLPVLSKQIIRKLKKIK